MGSKLWIAIISFIAFACNASAYTINAGSWIWTVPTSGGTANYVMTTSGSSGVTTWSQVALGSAVTGLLPLANGGCNKNMIAVAGGVLWTDGDSCEISAAGSSGQLLKSNGTSAPSWVNAVAASGATGSVQFAVGGVFASDNANLFWDDTNDRLGIGNATPSAQLHIRKDIDDTRVTSILLENAGAGAATAPSIGFNWGQYLSAPFSSGGEDRPLKLATGPSGASVYEFGSSGTLRFPGATPAIQTDVNNAALKISAENGTGATLTVRTGGDQLFKQYDGFTFPTVLALYGRDSVTPGEFAVSTGSPMSERLRIDDSGFVGIGTSTPNEQLEITDNMRMSGASILYLDASPFLHGDGGTGNFFGGYNANYSDISVVDAVGIGSGTIGCSRCVVVGTGAGSSLTGAGNYYHTFLGWRAGTNAETGGVNVTGGSDSISIGDASGFDSASPVNSIAIGPSTIGRTNNAVTLGNYAQNDFNFGSDLFANGNSIARTLRVGNAFGTDKNAGAVSIQGSISTGTGTGGDIVLKVAPAAASTGSSLNTPTEVMRMNAGVSPGTPYVTITDVGGNGGNVVHAFVRRTNTSTTSATCSVDCNVGEIAMGGGCSNTTALALQQNFPADDDTWSCEYALASGDCTAYAMCAGY